MGLLTVSRHLSSKKSRRIGYGCEECEPPIQPPAITVESDQRILLFTADDRPLVREIGYMSELRTL